MELGDKRKERVAIVTGANKGIGLEISRQLLEKGIQVVLTARDEARGQAAVRKLQDLGGKNVIFHQLDITEPASIASLKKFIETNFGKLDILINNAGVVGVDLKSESTFGEGDLSAFVAGIIEPYQKGKECIDINFYGTKAMCHSFIPLLQQSQSPRIVNVSSSYGKLHLIPGESIRKEIGDIDNLTEGRLVEMVCTFLDDFKEGRFKERGWHDSFSAYKVSKVAVSAYTRILAKSYPKIIVNCVCPGYVKTDLNYNTGTVSVEDGAKGPVMLALLLDSSLSGQFYEQTELSSF